MQQNREDLRKKRGNAIFRTITREYRNSCLEAKVPQKFSNDSGLGHVLDHYVDNKRKVNTKEKAVSGYISKLSRDNQFHKIQELKQ